MLLIMIQSLCLSSIRHLCGRMAFMNTGTLAWAVAVISQPECQAASTSARECWEVSMLPLGR